MLVKLDIPAGAWRNGTLYEAGGRWYDVNLVRWLDGSLRPVGGWQAWGASDITGIARGAYAWTDQAGDRWVAFGTAANLYVYDDSAALHDITPIDVAASGTLTLTGNAGNTETVTIGAKTYTFQTSLTDTDGNVLIGASASDSLDNLIAAITLGSGAGTTYATSTTAHPTATAAAGAGDTMTATALTAGTGGNALATTETLANGSWGATTMSGGIDGLTTGNVSATRAGGYGDGLYGAGAYGTPRADVDAVTLASTWSLDGWGQYLVGCMDGDGSIWEWQLNTSNNAAVVTNAPTECLGLVVTEERFLFALGAGGDPRAIAWCDQGDNTTWTATATNQAGDFKLETDGEIRCAIKVRGETLILTSTDIWAARYLGHPLVYGFTRLDSGCGSPGNRTAIAIGNRAVWLGHAGFFMYDGNVKKLRCDVWDYYQSRLSKLQSSKIFGWHNADHSEAWWLFPSDDTNECDSYIVWNYAEDWWSFGMMDRSCGVGRGTFDSPLLMGTDQTAYEHETTFDYDGDVPHAESGPFEIAQGERRIHATKLYPDEATLGSTTLTFKTREYPTADERTFGPYTMAEPTSVRFSGRQAVIRVDGGDDGGWRFGIPRIEVKAGGKR